MKAAQVIELFDRYWFRRQIIANPPSSSPPPPTPSLEFSEEESLKPALSRVQSRHMRSLSDQTSTPESWIMDSAAVGSPKLESIPSSKEIQDIEATEKPREGKQRRNRGRGRSRGRSTKSMSELEFEELKGFMDLGFVFSEEDRNSSLVSIIPGLQRLGKGEEEEKEVVVSRPYLSEAWEVWNERREMENKRMRNWRLPSLSNEIDMKDNLRSWAHNVASGVR